MKLFAILLLGALASAAVTDKQETELLTKGYKKAVSHYGYYKVYDVAGGRPYWDAWQQCDQDGGYLFIPNSQAEVIAVKELLSKFPNNFVFFVGVHDLFDEGQYYTMKGAPLEKSTYFKWAAGEPNNNSDNEDCVAIEGTGLFRDYKCSTSLFFVCEHDP